MATRRPVRVLIVDDEPPARHRIADLLRAQPDVEVVGTASSGTDAVAAIRALAPDLVFLDVQMPDGTGLDVVREIGPEAMPVTIFATAYDQYALRAFDAAAVDYLVKPFDDERFEHAFRRARRAVELATLGQLSGQLFTVLQGLQGEQRSPRSPTSSAPGTPPATVAAFEAGASAGAPPAPATPSAPRYLERIAVESRGQVRIVPVSKVLYIMASGPYAEVHTAEKRYLIREQMQVLEERLDPERFFRVHRSAIVRFDLIEALTRNASGDYTVQLKGGLALEVSRSRSDALERRMGLAK